MGSFHLPAFQALIFDADGTLVDTETATNGPRMKVTQTLGLSGLLPYFEDRIYCAYEVGSFKPDPGLFLHAATQLQVTPGQCAVVEDSLPGVLAGLAAGMRVLYVGPVSQLDPETRTRVHLVPHLGAIQEHVERQLTSC
jgi:beta-phosphoglucomutase-like phosphatase (HAD superfamily)